MTLRSTAAVALVMAVSSMAGAQTSETVVAGTASGNVVPGAACNATFAISDSDNDGTITREEFDTWNDAGFSALDADGDGDLSRSEFVDCMTIDAGDPEAADTGPVESLTSADADASGGVSADEYIAATDQAHRDAVSGQSDGPAILRRYIIVPSDMTDSDVGRMSQSEVASAASGKFRALDANRDGEVSPDELQQGGWDDMNAWLNLDFDEMDRSGDGVISRSEYDRYADRRWESSTSRAQDEADRAIYYLYFIPPQTGEEQ